MADANIWAPWFRNPATWSAWRVFLAALFGLPLSEHDLALYTECTGRTAPPRDSTTEAWLVVGRRGGKSLILALIACYLAVFRDWLPYLQPGETGFIKVLAVDRRQAAVIYRYARSLLLEVPLLRPLVTRDDRWTLELTNSVTIEVQTASFRSTRGFTLIAALCDEVAFWRNDESANPDAEILAALRPAMATMPGAMLLCASSPYARRGELWNHYRRYFGRDDAPALLWKADTRTMNPTVPQSVIDEATERDPANAAAEYGATFRTDIESYVSREVVDAATIPGRFELPPMARVSYVAFVDPSGGSSDSMTLAIAHRDGDKAVLDCIREVRPPFSPEAVVEEFAETLRGYHVHRIVGDRYAGEWPRERFKKCGIAYEPSDKTKSDIYRDALPLLNSRRTELLDHPRLIAQLCTLERRTARGGRDSIDHPAGAHDDLANSVCGALVNAIAKRPMIVHPSVLARSAMPHLGNRRTAAGSISIEDLYRRTNA